MYLNNLMTDDELIRAAHYAESRHLRLLAERLKARRDDMKTAHKAAASARRYAEEGEVAASADQCHLAESVLQAALDK